MTFKIGEVGKMLNIQPSALRYWEKEFPQLVPLRTDKGMRLYTEEQVALLRKIQHLLYEKGMKIGGVKQMLESGDEENPENEECRFGESGLIGMIRDELASLRQLLASSEGNCQ